MNLSRDLTSWTHSSMGERTVYTREVPGSSPGVSTQLFAMGNVGYKTQAMEAQGQWWTL